MDMRGAGIAAVGLLLVLWGAVPLSWSERRHAAKVQARIERGHDRYHEELRALRTYNPKQRRLILFGIGGVILATGLNAMFGG